MGTSATSSSHLLLCSGYRSACTTWLRRGFSGPAHGRDSALMILKAGTTGLARISALSTGRDDRRRLQLAISVMEERQTPCITAFCRRCSRAIPMPWSPDRNVALLHSSQPRLHPTVSEKLSVRTFILSSVCSRDIRRVSGDTPPGHACRPRRRCQISASRRGILAWPRSFRDSRTSRQIATRCTHA